LKTLLNRSTVVLFGPKTAAEEQFKDQGEKS
jgi:hypothetical protein